MTLQMTLTSPYNIAGIFWFKAKYLVSLDLNLNTDLTQMAQFQEKQ